MKFIKDEQEKINPTAKKSVADTKKNRPLEDDSVSEITDLDYEDVLHNYYTKKVNNIAQKRADRAASRRRLRGEPRKDNKIKNNDHKCRANAKQMAKMGVKGEGDMIVEMELRQKSEGASMQDEEHSAHQFSLREQSVQADSEERLEAEMQASNFENESSPNVRGRSRGIANRSLTRSQTNKSVVLMS